VEGFIVTFSNKARLAFQHKKQFYDFWQKSSAKFFENGCPVYLILLMQFNSVKGKGKVHPRTDHEGPEGE
jgi:hypothetical protein